MIMIKVIITIKIISLESSDEDIMIFFDKNINENAENINIKENFIELHFKKLLKMKMIF
jgi:hypothetical protein